MTHRVFSRNSSSSRAIPNRKLISKILDDPALPVWWGKNQRGMQAKEELDDVTKGHVLQRWLHEMNTAVNSARYFDERNLHKQIANRIIEAWMHMEIVMSTTTLSNFFLLRDHTDAQPEIATLARKMRAVYEDSIPRRVVAGEWHIPFIRPEEEEKLDLQTKLKVSVARCARVSYLTHDGKRDIDKDIELHDFLIKQKPLHSSPGEHCAKALEAPEQYGNFRGWLQYRKMLPDEAASHEMYDWDTGEQIQ